MTGCPPRLVATIDTKPCPRRCGRVRARRVSFRAFAAVALRGHHWRSGERFASKRGSDPRKLPPELDRVGPRRLATSNTGADPAPGQVVGAPAAGQQRARTRCGPPRGAMPETSPLSSINAARYICKTICAWNRGLSKLSRGPHHLRAPAVPPAAEGGVGEHASLGACVVLVGATGRVRRVTLIRTTHGNHCWRLLAPPSPKSDTYKCHFSRP